MVRLLHYIISLDVADHYLGHFGKDPNNTDLAMAEEFLVNVYKPGTKYKTLDELQYQLYYQSKKTILALPPSSRTVEGHILWSFFGTYMQIHCLESPLLSPINFGYMKSEGGLQPHKLQVLLPEDFPMPCSCIACATSRCCCRKVGMECCPCCDCKSVETPKCKN